MGLFSFLKATPKPQSSVGDVLTTPSDSIHKAYIPNHIYKPPFGFPRMENLLLIRELAVNPYIYSVIKAIQDEAASTPIEVVYKAEAEPTPALDAIKEEITKFLDNPNGNKESFQDILRMVVRDICELDSAVIVKVFNKAGELGEIFARDGASFTKNPDRYGYMGNREDLIFPLEYSMMLSKENPDAGTFNQYGAEFKERAAYFQYGFTGNTLPVPFGKREIIFLMQNPRSDSVYGRSPIAVLADVIQSLIYGANYNLDFYQNNNMPEGVLSVIDADEQQLARMKAEWEKRLQTKSSLTGFVRRQFYKVLFATKQVDFKPFQLDPKLMQIIEQQQWFTKLVWTCFGVTPDELGFTEDSNKAVSQTQQAVYKRRAVRPILALLKYHLDKEIISEWGDEAFRNLEFKWDEYDLDEDLKKHQLYQMQLQLGIKTPEMIAKDAGIDMEEWQKSKEEYQDEQIKMNDAMNPEPEKPAPAKKADNSLEVALKKRFEQKSEEFINALELIEKGSIKNVE